MFIVISNQNHSDTTVPVQIPLGLSDNPSAALSMARTACKSEYKAFIDSIVIFSVEVNKAYTYSDFKKNVEPLVYMCYKKLGGILWEEVFFERFKIFNRRKISTNSKEDEKATVGKFRAIVMYDSDTVMQIDVDTTREDAYWLCLWAVADTGLPFQVFNDEGEPQVERGQLKKLETA